MKQYFILSLFCVLGTSLLGQTEDDPRSSTREIKSLEGSPLIQTQKSYVYEYQGGQLVKSDLQSMSHYDLAGLEQERVYVKGDGTQARRIRFSYDSIGHLQERLYYNQQDELTERHVYSYNEGGKIRSKKVFHVPAQRLAEWVLFDYNEYGQLLSERRFEGDSLRSNQLASRELEYDPTGLLLAQDFYDAEGLIYQSYWYDYDAEGKETDFMSLDQEGNLLAQRRTKYHAQGKEQISLLGNEMVPTRITQEFRQLSGGIREEKNTYYYQGKISKIESFRYDRDQRLLLYQMDIFDKSYANGKHSERLESVYNTFGLLSESSEYIDGKLQKRRLYIYEYFE